jgi:hypothetical protein
MLRALANGEADAAKMSELARRQLKRKTPEWKRALEGRLTAAPRWTLGELRDQYTPVEGAL